MKKMASEWPNEERMRQRRDTGTHPAGLKCMDLGWHLKMSSVVMAIMVKLLNQILNKIHPFPLNAYAEQGAESMEEESPWVACQCTLGTILRYLHCLFLDSDWKTLDDWRMSTQTPHTVETDSPWVCYQNSTTMNVQETHEECTIAYNVQSS